MLLATGLAVYHTKQSNQDMRMECSGWTAEGVALVEDRKCGIRGRWSESAQGIVSTLESFGMHVLLCGSDVM